tara:strand:+ start:124 stop:408 length:285 start_codon:yes stop_codon:yes gene_type:complete
MEYSIFPTKASALKWARENLIDSMKRPSGDDSLFCQKSLKRWHPNSDTCKQWKLTYRKEDLIPIMSETELDNLLMDAGVDPAAMVARTLKKIEV